MKASHDVKCHQKKFSKTINEILFHFNSVDYTHLFFTHNVFGGRDFLDFDRYTIYPACLSCIHFQQFRPTDFSVLYIDIGLYTYCFQIIFTYITIYLQKF